MLKKGNPNWQLFAIDKQAARGHGVLVISSNSRSSSTKPVNPAVPENDIASREAKILP